MPIRNYFTIRGGSIVEERDTLFRCGPICEIEVSIPTAAVAAYQQSGTPIPAPKAGYALIDTGCTVTSVDEDILKGLGISQVGVGTSLTAGGPVQQNTYPVHIRVVGTSIEVDYSSVMSSDLSQLNYNGSPIIALIGRDILADCVFIYNGVTGMYTFAH